MRIDELRSHWRNVGRQVWEVGTRLGQDIKAQTEQQLEALGRDHLRQSEQQQAQDRAMAQSVKAVTQRAGRAAKDTLVKAGGQISSSQSTERDVVEAMPAAAANVTGKVWNAPNTLIGLAYGAAGYLAGLAQSAHPYVVVEDNAVQFRNNPLGGVGAITLGNTTTYEGDPADPTGDWARYNSSHASPVQEHERQHTIQGQQLGPLYLPSNLAGGGLALLRDRDWHGPSNWNERGPQRVVPRPW